MDRTTTMIGAALVALALSPAATAVEIFALHTDHAGSVIMETDKDRNITWQGQYEPYGLPRQTAPEGPGYTGHVHDQASGLVYMQQRYYDPEVGRFLSIDPAAVDTADARNFNRYNYAANNPYGYVDPDGRNAFAWAAVLGFAGGAGVETYSQWKAGDGYNTRKIAVSGAKGAVIGLAVVAGGSAGAALAISDGAGVVAANVARVAAGAYSGGGTNLAISAAADIAAGGEMRPTGEYLVESGATAIGSIVGSGVSQAVTRSLSRGGAAPAVAAAVGEISGELSGSMTSEMASQTPNSDVGRRDRDEF